MADPIAQLPAFYRAVAPELDAVALPSERLATCTSCAMAPKPGQNPDKPRAFTHTARCCTYNPSLPNHAVGRILRREDRGAERMRARIAAGGGVGPEGVRPTQQQTDRYREIAGEYFGRTDEIVCPYWVLEAQGCTIWADRNAVCRTWFCKYEDGPRGRELWGSVRNVIEWIEWRAAIHLISLGTPPSEGARTNEWVGWFRWCAERADLFGEADIALLRSAAIAHRAEQVAKVTLDPGPLPDVVVPCFDSWHRVDGKIFATSYSALDMTELPGWAFALISRLDGVRTWQTAVAELSAEQGAPIDPALIAMMWSRGLLIAPLAEGTFKKGGAAVAFPDGSVGEYPDLVDRVRAVIDAG